MEGIKYDQDKLRFDLMPPNAEEAVADVLTYGATKYAPNNWKKLDNLEERYIAAALRHINAHRKGEPDDPESGRLHLAHAICGLMFIIESWYPDDDSSTLATSPVA